MKQPFAKTWWVKEGQLLAGCFPGTEEPTGTEKRVAALVSAGIRTFISLQEADERNVRTGTLFPHYEPILCRLQQQTGQTLEFHRFPVPDGTAPTPAAMAKALDVIDESLARGMPVYVHCWGGHGRTGTVIGCWLVRHGARGGEALKTITRLRSVYPELIEEPAPQTDDQCDLVRRWAGLDPAPVAVSGSKTSCPSSSPATSSNSPLLVGVEPLDLQDRYLGAMFGLAAGDAVGTTLEFMSPGTFSPISDMVGGGPFDLSAGQWTDDTSMALCLAESLIHVAGSAPDDQMRRYVAWWQKGHLSSTGTCFDIGNATSSALARFMQTRDPFAGSDDPKTAGNGSLMRLAPIPLAYRLNPDSAIDMAAQSSMTTHAAIEAVDACRFMTVMMIRALEGATKEELLHESLWETSLHHPTAPLAPKVLTVARGSYKKKMPPALRGTGYVVDCLEAALWAFHHHDSYEQAVLAAANLGDDADTTAAVCGQLAGAFYGLTGIPAHWVEQVALSDTIADLARGLLVLSRFLGESVDAGPVPPHARCGEKIDPV